jgi:hypothetical protein
MSAVLPSGSTTAAPPIGSTLPTSVRTGAADKPSSDGVVGAVERLALSRERLRAAMLPKPRASSGPSITDGLGEWAGGFVERLRASPGVAVIVDAVEDWWAKHPLHTAGVMAAEASRRLAAPVAERRPLTLLFGAVFVGAVLALLKPWRLLLRPAVFAGLLPAILLRVMRQMPVDTWLRAAASGFGTSRGPATDALDESSGTPVATDATVATVARPVAPVSSVEAVRNEPSTVYP